MRKTQLKEPKPASTTEGNGTGSAKSPTDLDPLELYRIYVNSGRTVWEMVTAALREGTPADKADAYEIFNLLGLAHMERALLDGNIPLTQKIDWWFRHRSLTEGSKVAVSDQRQPQSSEVVEARIAASQKRLEEIARKYVVGKATNEQMVEALTPKPSGDVN
jgi:hypothetical protein